MSMLTTAASRTYRPQGLRATAALGLVAGTVVATGLLLLHVQLRFAIDDLKRETRDLQKERARLDNEYSQAESSLEALKTGDRILNRAREMGMINYDSTQAGTLKVSKSRMEEWLACDPAWSAGSPASERIQFADRLEDKGAEKVEAFLNAIRLKSGKDKVDSRKDASG
jgi:hypothetical protein